jgi:1-acyl-sn-glycerol-3-phosphate acyltransferase
MYFFISIFFIGIIIPILSICNLYNYTKKEILFFANNCFKKWLKYDAYVISNNKLITNNIIYLSNHVSFSDFIFDSMITNYSSKFFSRYNIVIFFPLFFIISKITDSVIFFNKPNATNINNFFKWINFMRKSDMYNNILVYPEGIRRPYAKEPINLKKGFIYYSYQYDIPIQIIHTHNKESIIQESTLSVGFNNSIFVYYSKEINPIKLKKKNYTDEQYLEYVQNYWNKIWFKVKNNKNINNYILNKNKYSKTIQAKYTPLENVISNNNNILPVWFLLLRIIFYIVIIYFIFF